MADFPEYARFHKSIYKTTQEIRRVNYLIKFLKSLPRPVFLGRLELALESIAIS